MPKKRNRTYRGNQPIHAFSRIKTQQYRSGKYIWFKAHDKVMERRRRSTRNAALAPELVWRIKKLIIEEQWSPRQISGVLKKEGVSVSHQ